MRDKVPAVDRGMNYWMRVRAPEGLRVDNFAEYMGADYDSNGDGVVDRRRCALRGRRKRGQLRHPHHLDPGLTLRDANTHFVSSSSSYDYIQSGR